jgi:hypothetical protein
MDLGTALFTGMVKGAYDRLREHLGFGRPGRIIERTQQLVEVDEQILRCFDVDLRALSQDPPDRTGDVELDDERYRDEWGVVRRKPPRMPLFRVGNEPAGRSAYCRRRRPLSLA